MLFLIHWLFFFQTSWSFNCEVREWFVSHRGIIVAAVILQRSGSFQASSTEPDLYHHITLVQAVPPLRF